MSSHDGRVSSSSWRHSLGSALRSVESCLLFRQPGQCVLSDLLPAMQEAKHSAPQGTTDAGADDLQALAAKLKKKHLDGAGSQQQSGNDRGDAAAFLAGSVTAIVPNSISNDDSGKQPKQKRKKAKVSEEQDVLKKQRRRKAEQEEPAEAALPGAMNGKEKRAGKKRKLKGAEDGAPAAQSSKRQLADAGAEPVTGSVQRTKQKKFKRTTVTDEQ